MRFANRIFINAVVTLVYVYPLYALGQWQNTGVSNLPRAGHTATLLPDGTVLVVAGRYFDG